MLTCYRNSEIDIATILLHRTIINMFHKGNREECSFGMIPQKCTSIFIFLQGN
jgi:hypothetical protein